MKEPLELKNFPALLPSTHRTGSVALAVTLAAGALWSGSAAASLALAQRNSCTACHQPATRIVGPSWKEIAEKYNDGKTTADQLAESIKRGSTGKWGAVPMPAQVQVSDSDLKAIAQWLLDGAK